MKRLIIILSIVFLAACGDKKIDMSSKQSFNESTAEIVKTLSKEDQEKFAMGLMSVGMQSMMQANGDEQKGFELMKSKIDGKTAQDVIKEYGKK